MRESSTALYKGMKQEKIDYLEQAIVQIQQRNQKVEGDKAWETSKFRIGLIMAMTYVVAVALLYEMKNPHFFLNALIPTMGYFLSTQSLPTLKKWRIRTYFK
ncbi:MAG: hypothetical protein ACD_28C00379G0009 [uncultured bacterium]|nr:MAG: hypothetical protein ACD_28C00379G0009 [uncultured bacterium]KKT74021.1 MAG: hypothetical protein UW70_C0069G0015 [Candidatus Peregrinibacteria bacterium GW2011_GWA2_44_7]